MADGRKLHAVARANGPERHPADGPLWIAERPWELDTGHPLAILEGHTDWVTACAVTPDGRRAITASDDRTLRIWELDTGHAVATLEGHTGWGCTRAR